MLKKIIASICLSTVSITAMAVNEWAPDGTVRIIVPIMGTTNDILARTVAPVLEEIIGQSVVVENKPGAGGAIGTQYVLGLPKDGKTLLVGYNGPLTINPTLFKKIAYDPLDDLVPLNLTVAGPQYLVVNKHIGVNNFDEFLDYVKDSADGVSYGSVSIGSASHLTMEMFKDQTGLEQLVHIPYDGAPKALLDLQSGRIDAAFMVPGNVLPYMETGDLIGIATSGTSRFERTPDIPTVAEMGYPDFVALSWIGFLIPEGTELEAIGYWQDALQKAVADERVTSKLLDLDFEVLNEGGDYFQSWLQEDLVKWQDVIEKAEISVE